MCRGECYSFLEIAPLTLDPYLITLSVKQGGIKYHFFFILWYDLTWNWTPVYRTNGEHSNYYANDPVLVYLFNGTLTPYGTIGLMCTVFANGLGDRSSIPGRIIQKTQKMVLDAALLNTQHYKVWIKWSNLGNRVLPTLPGTSVL